MLKIKDINSALEIIKGLILNNYVVHIRTIYQEFPRENYIDYYEITYLTEEIGE